jgi:hypothetical protein
MMTSTEIENHENSKFYMVLFTGEEKPDIKQLKKLLRTKNDGKIYSRSGPYSGVFSVFNQLHQFLGANADDCWNNDFSSYTTYIFASSVKCNLMLANFSYDIEAYEVTAKELNQLRVALAEFFEFASKVNLAEASISNVKTAHNFFSALEYANHAPIEEFVSASSIGSIGDNFKKFITPHIDARKQVLMQWVEKHRMSVV